MKDFAKKLLKMLFNKTVLVYLLGALTGAAGLQVSNQTLGSIVCSVMPAISGCEAPQTKVDPQ